MENFWTSDLCTSNEASPPQSHLLMENLEKLWTSDLGKSNHPLLKIRPCHGELEKCSDITPSNPPPQWRTFPRRQCIPEHYRLVPRLNLCCLTLLPWMRCYETCEFVYMLDITVQDCSFFTALYPHLDTIYIHNTNKYIKVLHRWYL